MNISSPHKYSFIFTSYIVFFLLCIFKVSNTLFQLTAWDSRSVCIEDMGTLQKCIKATNLYVEPRFIRLNLGLLGYTPGHSLNSVANTILSVMYCLTRCCFLSCAFSI